MLARSIKSRLDNAIRLAEAQRGESPFIPQSDWPPGLIEAHREFDQRLAAVGGNRYEALMDLIGEAPITVLKEPWNSMRASGEMAVQRELFLAVANAVRAPRK